jgi:Zn-dependent peptidase ImmA (M78 family)
MLVASASAKGSNLRVNLTAVGSSPRSALGATDSSGRGTSGVPQSAGIHASRLAVASARAGQVRDRLIAGALVTVSAIQSMSRPIWNMVHLLEAHGIRVFSLTDDTKDLDAYSFNWHGQHFILLSREKSGERHRFNGAHELGHLVLHGEDKSPNGPEAEAEANQFAAAFLMPKAGVLPNGLRNAHVHRILHAKKRWNVAAMAMAHRANELGLTARQVPSVLAPAGRPVRVRCRSGWAGRVWAGRSVGRATRL